MEQSDHFKHVKSIYDNYKEDEQLLNDLLPANPELASFMQEHRKMFGKNLVVFCANFFELFTLDSLPILLSDKKTVCSFLRKQALDRRYHQLFDWDKQNVNKFLTCFGENFRDKISKEIEADQDLKNKMGSFLELGRWRNKLVHEGFKLEAINEKSIDDIWSNFVKSCDFYKFILDKLKYEVEYIDYSI